MAVESAVFRGWLRLPAVYDDISGDPVCHSCPSGRGEAAPARRESGRSTRLISAPGKGLFQPSAGAVPALPRPGPVPPAGPRPCRVPPAPHDRFGRSRAAAAEAGFPPAGRQRPRHRSPGMRPNAALRSAQRQITLGAVGQHFHRRIGAGQPRRQPRQISGIAALGGERRHQRAQPRPCEIRIAIGRIVGEADSWPCSASRSVAISKPPAAAAPDSTPSRSDSRAIAARPAMPLPRSIRINSVSA